MKGLEVVAMLIILTFSNAQVMSQKTPMFYGWFFDEIVADGLKRITDYYLMGLYLNVDEVRMFLRNLSTVAGVENPLQYYTKPPDPNMGEYDEYYHITAFYCGTNDCSSYSRRVEEYLNGIFVTHLVGVFFTPRTYGIRVDLTSIQREIFEIAAEINGFDDRSMVFAADDDNCEAELLDKIKFCPQNDSNFHPTDTRAHVTLGCAPNISAVVTGLDLIDILEIEVDPSQICNLIQAEQGNLIQMGRNCDIFVYYLKNEMIANSTFETYYNNASNKTGLLHSITTLLALLVYYKFL